MNVVQILNSNVSVHLWQTLLDICSSSHQVVKCKGLRRQIDTHLLKLIYIGIRPKTSVHAMVCRSLYKTFTLTPNKKRFI